MSLRGECDSEFSDKDTVYTEFKNDENQDEIFDPSYIEMLQSIKSLLEIKEPEVVSEAPVSLQ